MVGQGERLDQLRGLLLQFPPNVKVASAGARKVATRSAKSR
jgi:hypothetical protein